MDNDYLNTKYVFEFEDGTTCTMTLAFYALYLLKGKNKSLYERYNRAMNNIADKKTDYDELDSLTILYAAYVCANINEDSLLSEADFLMKCGSNRFAVSRAAKALTQPKNSQAFGNRSLNKPVTESNAK